ncbi:MAG: dTDP-4-dehydrorhamnose 3,5-epimerase [Bacteroidales bacterium]|nr:dTDP-4-dehydrorhamnose 3,5-epimerase [Bacteroidales bacterium]
MDVKETKIKGVFIIEPKVFEDERGYFMESFSKRDFCEKVLGISYEDYGDGLFVQDNESKSSYGVIRGLHYQKPPFTQAKLLRVISGKVLDIVVDIRKGSPTFGKYVSAELTGENHRQLFAPRGFAHGFSVLSSEAVFQYKCDNFYTPQADSGIAWNDPDIAVDWRIPQSDVILSEKDEHQPMLRDSEPVFYYGTKI